MQNKRKRLALWGAGGVLALFASFLLALSTGDGRVDLGSLFYFFTDDAEWLIIQEIRLPRALAAVLAGGLLGLSGAIMQSILKNPLASPYTLGVAQAAAAGASFAIIVLEILQNDNPYVQWFGVAGFAFVASLACMGLVLYIGHVARMSPPVLILAGVALGALFNSLTMMLQFFASDINAAAALFWTFGDLAKGAQINLAIMAVFLVAIGAFLWQRAWQLDTLSLGDDTAKTRGINVGRLRILALMLSALAASVVVSYFGIIGFVGLAAAHLVRLLVGGSNAVLIPFSVIFGGALLALADVASKLLLPPIIIPIGIVTSFMGVPLLLYLLSKKGARFE